ncbi:hypothetical protein DV736_g1887, partial [Chaetothyriales sp. CBS 134916]
MTGAETDASKSVKPTYHYGRGGAGNVTAKTSDGIKEEEMTTPTLKAKIYTTGRGGTGNMAKNDDPEEARAAQDVETPGFTLPEGPHHTGRGMSNSRTGVVIKRTTNSRLGGAANMYKPNNAERLEAKEHNERVRRESFKSSSRERPAGLKGLAPEGKEAVKAGSDKR